MNILFYINYCYICCVLVVRKHPCIIVLLCRCGLAPGHSHCLILFNTVHILFLLKTIVVAPHVLRDTACVHYKFIAADFFSPLCSFGLLASRLCPSIHPSKCPAGMIIKDITMSISKTPVFIRCWVVMFLFCLRGHTVGKASLRLTLDTCVFLMRFKSDCPCDSIWLESVMPVVILASLMVLCPAPPIQITVIYVV